MFRLTVGEVARIKGAQHRRVSSKAAGSETPACSHPCESGNRHRTGSKARVQMSSNRHSETALRWESS